MINLKDVIVIKNFILYALLGALVISDYFLTSILIQAHGTTVEANPLMRMMFEYGGGAAIAFKAFTYAILAIPLLLDMPDRTAKYYSRSLQLVTIFYAIVIVYSSILVKYTT